MFKYARRSVDFVKLMAIGGSLFFSVIDFSLAGSSLHYQNSSRIKTWQSFHASPEGGIHYWNETASDLTIARVGNIPGHARSVYGFVSGGVAVFYSATDLKRDKYTIRDNELVRIERGAQINSEKYRDYGFEYDVDLSNGLAKACRISDLSYCVSYKIHPGTAALAYASANGSVMLATSYEDLVGPEHPPQSA